MRPRITIIFLTIIIISSCSYPEKEFNLTNFERALLQSFQAGDTIFYISTAKDVDTIRILGVDSVEKKERGWLMAKPAYKDVWVSIKHLPEDTDYTQVISIRKLPQSNEVQYAFKFRNFFVIKNNLPELHEDSLLINDIQIDDYYIIKNDRLGRQDAPTDIECLFWTKKEGLVAYKYNSGAYWTKKSSR